MDLKGTAPAAEEDEEESVAAAPAVPSSQAEECDEYDPDCEDDDDEDYSKYKTSAPVEDDRDYAASAAASDVGDRFGIADEVRFWTAVGLSALAVTAAVIGIVQHSKANEAKDAYDELHSLNTKILATCGGNTQCEEILSAYAARDGWTLSDMQRRMNENKDTQDSYTTARNIWFGVSAASIAGAVVLFVW